MIHKQKMKFNCYVYNYLLIFNLYFIWHNNIYKLKKNENLKFCTIHLKVLMLFDEYTESIFMKDSGDISSSQTLMKNLDYWLEGIDKGDSSCMFNLGRYYDDNQNYEKMKKYYLMAIDKGGCTWSMNNLGIFYYIRKEYESMKKYYLMAINKGDIRAMFNLGLYYEDIYDYENMIKYYMMAANKGYHDAMNNLGVYYYNIKNDKDNFLKYYLMASNRNNLNATINLYLYYNYTKPKDIANIFKYSSVIKKRMPSINISDLHKEKIE